MAKPEEYRLKTLLRMREKTKSDAEQALGHRIAELKAEQEKLHEMQLELERMIQARESKKREYAEKQMRGEMSAQDVMAANVYLEKLKELEAHQEEAIEVQHGVIAQRKEAVNSAREALVVAERELKALEKHKEKWLRERKKARDKREEDQLDEIAQGIHQRRDRDG